MTAPAGGALPDDIHSAPLAATRVAAAQTPQPQCAPDSIITYWEDLLCAVKTRLRDTVVPPSDAPGGVAAAEPAAVAARGVRDGVLDCVAALDQLHQALRHELRHRHQIELELFDVQTELALARSERAGNRAG